MLSSAYPSKHTAPFNPTAILLKHAREMFSGTRLSRAKFGERIAALYDQVPRGPGKPMHFRRYEDVRTEADYRRVEAALKRQIQNLESGITRFPADLMWPWLEAMEEPYRTACSQELHSAMFGINGLPPEGQVRSPGGGFVY